jgi:type IV pilus assembly protein PilP
MSRARASLSRSLFVAALAALLVSCADARMTELEAYAERVRAREPGPLEPIPEIEPVESFVYSAGDRRDPFTMDDRSAEVAQQREPNGLAPDPARRKEPLEAYSLDSMRMVGTLEQYRKRWALITTPDGVLHRVRVGDYIGRNNGRIVRIEPRELQLSELVEEAPGEWQRREASMALTE